VPSIMLSTYAVEVSPRYSHDLDYLGNVAGGKGVLSIIKRVLAQFREQHLQDEVRQNLVRVASLKIDGDDAYGIILAGEYGYSADGVNVRTKKGSYRRTPEDAELIPLYFRISVPEQAKRGVLILQRFGTHGVHGPFTDAFRQYFSEKLEHTIHFLRLAPAEVVAELLNGEVREISVTTYSVPDDISNKYRYVGNPRDVGTFTMSFKAKKDGIALFEPPWLKKIRSGKARVVTLPVELGGEDARLRIKVSYKGKTRTVDMSKPDNIAPYIDVTADVDVLDSGHPSFESIDNIATEIRDSLMIQLGQEE